MPACRPAEDRRVLSTSCNMLGTARCSSQLKHANQGRNAPRSRRVGTNVVRSACRAVHCLLTTVPAVHNSKPITSTDITCLAQPKPTPALTETLHSKLWQFSAVRAWVDQQAQLQAPLASRDSSLGAACDQVQRAQFQVHVADPTSTFVTAVLCMSASFPLAVVYQRA